jgi:hypothetical protein
MSIGKRIAEAVEKSSKGDPEGALISVSIAIDATASKLYGKIWSEQLQEVHS